MTDRIQLPSIAPAVESDAVVRARALARLRWVSAGLIALLAAVGARGVQLSLLPSERTLRTAAVQRWDTVTHRARRGQVFDRNGHRLAISVATPNVLVDPTLVGASEVAGLATRLSDLLGLAPEVVAQKLSLKSRYQRLALRVHPAVAAEIGAIDHPAIWVERETRRYYPEGTLAAHVLGFVDADDDGREGIEAALDRYLRGGVVLEQRRRDRRGMNVDDPSPTTEPNAGMDVHLTLDRSIQRITEHALARAMERSAPLSASAIVVHVPTGDLLALANAPTFNPNELTDDALSRRNHALQDAIEPGSVFKPFTIASALAEGVVRPDTLVNCEGGTWFVGRSRIRDDHPSGILSVSEVLSQSSNIGSAKIALEVGADVLIGYLRAFGFGEETGLGLPGERSGFVRPADRIRPIELATTSYGQGVTTTPLQLAMAVAALGNGGILMKPRLVTRVEDVHGVPEVVQQPEAVRRVVSKDIADAVIDMMETVTEPSGPAPLGAVSGYRVAGKTGTAEKVEDGRYGDGRIASFVSLVPAEQPVLAIVVTIDEPSVGSHYGAQAAAPVSSEIAAGSLRYLGVPPSGGGAVDPLTQIKPEVPREELRVAWMGDGWQMPDLSGRLLRESVRVLEPAGLELTLRGSGRVIQQTPIAGTKVPAGGHVSLVLR
ncbi:MAG TPA: PASTA domain-containing protein [Deltaproteobacteria bacterium]|nr:PASTA domain-containing protein [Deltaproteobacteria bacterium]